MTTDKVFILLLVILFPLSGCLDVTDAAEAEESEEETTIINNYYYNNTTTAQSVEMPDIVSHHLRENQTLNLSFDGTFTYQLETNYRHYCSTSILQPNCSWASDSIFGVEMTCDGGLLMESLSINVGQFLPVLPNESCNFSISTTSWEQVLVFSTHTLG